MSNFAANQILELCIAVKILKGFTFSTRLSIIRERLHRESCDRMATTSHCVIGTVKLHGSSAWNFIGTFFKNIFNGCRDYVNMVPDKITLATCQC